MIGITSQAAQASPPLPTVFQTLVFGSSGTFLTGIRGNTIVGNYTLPGGATGGLAYSIATQAWSPMPVATANGANYPGAISSSPYGPSFGSPGGILRVVGSYQTAASAPYDLSYLYDGAAAPGQVLTALAYPGPGTLFTIAHSTFGSQAVGNYDTTLATGNAFVYAINTGVYTTANVPGAVSTTAYGIYGDKIAGGYTEALPGGLLGPEHGYIHDQSTGITTTYDHAGAIATHFEGITGAGRAGEYNLVTNWVSLDGVVHPAVMHVAADGTVTWYEINIPGDVVSANSADGDQVIGISTTNGVISGYLATVPGLYNPIRNTTPLVVAGNGATGVATNPGGDDVINGSTILVSGSNAVGIAAETYGVITNNGAITVTGLSSTGVQMGGLYGTLLNNGSIVALPGATAVSSGPGASGTVVVNSGVIDGRVNLSSGPLGRFENSGVLGVSAPGAGVTHAISGTFVQTSAGTLVLRIGANSNDRLLTDIARLGGALTASFQSTSLAPSYTLITATQALTGTFNAVTSEGLPALFGSSLDYSANMVRLSVVANLAGQPNLTPNQQATGAAIDSAINSGGATLTPLPAALTPLYGLTAAQLPGALSALSGEAYASQQTVLIGDSQYTRQAVLGRLRQALYGDQPGLMGALGYGGPAAAYAMPEARNAPFAVKEASAPRNFNGTVWAQAFGSRANYDDGSAVSSVKATLGGFVTGVDVTVADWLVGVAGGYTRSSADVGRLSSSSTVDTGLMAIYAGTTSGPWNLRLGASYAFSQIDALRTIAYPGFAEQARADYRGNTGQAFAEVGYGFAFQTLAVEPFAGLAVLHLGTDGFVETGASAGLAGQSGSRDIGYSSLGLRVATVMEVAGAMTLKPHLSVAWQYAFGDTAANAQLAFLSVPSAGFAVVGVPLARNTALVEIGADLHVSDRASLGASYVGQYADGATVNALQANFKWRF